MNDIWMVVGCPGSGKSWVCEQLEDKFEYVHHDAHIKMEGDAYVKEIIKRSKDATKPLLIETPFSMKAIMEPLQEKGFKIIPVFIQEKPEVISDRYQNREKKEIPKGHLTRQNTYAQRAQEIGAFSGTSEEVLNHLKLMVGSRQPREKLISHLFENNHQ